MEPVHRSSTVLAVVWQLTNVEERDTAMLSEETLYLFGCLQRIVLPAQEDDIVGL